MKRDGFSGAWVPDDAELSRLARRRGGEAAEQTTGAGGFDFGASSTGMVAPHAGMLIQPRDPLPVALVLLIELQRDPLGLERQPANDHLLQFLDACAGLRRDGNRRRIHGLEARALVRRQPIPLVE